MAVNSRAVSVTTAATRLDGTESGYLPDVGTAVFNAGAVTVYLGGSGVTTAAGYPLAAGEHLGIDLEKAGALYGIVATGTCEVRVLEAEN